jgi:hypothetical protein
MTHILGHNFAVFRDIIVCTYNLLNILDSSSAVERKTLNFSVRCVFLKVRGDGKTIIDF